MVFFLSLRQTPNGQIEPDVLPSSASAHSHTALFTHPKSSGFSGTFGEYVTTWDFSGEKGALARKCACFLALLFHLPVNVISTMAHGWSPWIVLYLLLSVLNLACVAVGLWKLDVMRGQRLFYSSIYNRRHFDAAILMLLVVYGFFFGMILFAKLRVSTWVWFLRIIWPCLTVADIFCFIAGWVATWRDVIVG